MNAAHLKRFIAAIEDHKQHDKGKQWLGQNPMRWWEWVSSKTDAHFHDINLPDKKLSRDELKDICKKGSRYSDLECLIAVMAWGGQNRRHGVWLLNRFEELQSIIAHMRQDKISHLDAYDRFLDAWKKPEKLGMGAAYFTKLIFFCRSEFKSLPTGYIMDQWTAKSINLIFERPVVHLATHQVSKKNTSQNYDDFCQCIEKLSQKLNKPGETIEAALFSKGGKNKWPWRQYVDNSDRTGTKII